MIFYEYRQNMIFNINLDVYLIVLNYNSKKSENATTFEKIYSPTWCLVNHSKIGKTLISLYNGMTHWVSK